MLCFLFENLKKTTLKKLFELYKKTYFDNEIRDNINVDIDYGIVSNPKETVAEFQISSKEFNNVKQNIPASCKIIFNKDINFNSDDLKEILLHEMTHLWQLSKNPDKFEYTNHDIEFSEKLIEISKKYKSEIRINLTPKELASQYKVNKSYKLLNSNLKLVVICAKTIPIQATKISTYVFKDVVEFIKNTLKTSTTLKNCTVEEVLDEIDVDVVNAFGTTRSEIHRNYTTFDSNGSFDVNYTNVESLPEETQWDLFLAKKKKL